MDGKICGKCKKQFEMGQLYSCDGCKKLFCMDCADLTSSEIKCLQLKTKRRLIFLCDICEKGFWMVPQLSEEIKKLKEKIEKFSEQGNQEPRRSNNQNEPKDLFNVQANNEAIIMEMIERQKRESNIMISNVEESQLQSADERKNEDIQKICTILKNYNIVTTDIKVYRVGKPMPNKNRLLKVTLKNREEALQVLRNKNKINAAQQVKMFSDQTKKQREYYNLLKNQMQTMGDADTKTIRYINNVPTIVMKSNGIRKN